MFDRIFGNYLVETGKLSKSQLESVYTSQEENRVRLGVIAISEKLMTIEQVEEVNKMQAVMDKRFGDIAVEYHYLSQEQVKRLLCQQGNIYLTFIQTILDKEYLSMEQIASSLDSFQRKNSFTLTDIEALKSCDAERIVPLYLMQQSETFCALITLLVKTISRLIDYHVSIDGLVKIPESTKELLSIQLQNGDHNIFTGIMADEESMTKAAIAFAGKKFILEKEDSLDAMCEFINCVNGLFATKMSNEQIDVDMMPPEYFMNGASVTGSELYKLTLYVCGTKLDYLISFDNEIKINSDGRKF